MVRTRAQLQQGNVSPPPPSGLPGFEASVEAFDEDLAAATSNGRRRSSGKRRREVDLLGNAYDDDDDLWDEDEQRGTLRSGKRFRRLGYGHYSTISELKKSHPTVFSLKSGCKVVGR